jgi:hypothetical protein
MSFHRHTCHRIRVRLVKHSGAQSERRGFEMPITLTMKDASRESGLSSHASLDESRKRLGRLLFLGIKIPRDWVPASAVCSTSQTVDRSAVTLGAVHGHGRARSRDGARDLLHRRRRKRRCCLRFSISASDLNGMLLGAAMRQLFSRLLPRQFPTSGDLLLPLTNHFEPHRCQPRACES